MDDAENDDYHDEDVLEDRSYRACYVFRSGYKHQAGSRERPSKKRKLNDAAHYSTGLTKLSQTDDSVELVSRRTELFDNLWKQQQAKFNQDVVDEDRVNQLSDYLLDTVNSASNGRLATALVLTGLDATNYSSLMQRLVTTFDSSKSVVLVDLESRHCPNTQVALKNLIKTVIVEHSSLDEYNGFLAKHKRLLPLNFDLELLERFMEENVISKIVVSLSDIETFDSQSTNELLATFHSWQQRIPIALILGITSTRELFEHRLSKASLKYIHACSFTFSPEPDLNSNLLHLIQNCEGLSTQIFLGPSIISALTETSQTQGCTANALKDVLKYLYMSHFFANSIAVLANPDPVSLSNDSIKHVAKAVRATDSFREHCEHLLAQKQQTLTAKVRSMLEDDKVLLDEVQQHIADGQILYQRACHVIHAFAKFSAVLPKADGKRKKSKLDVESQLYYAMGDLTDTATYDDVAAYLQSNDALDVLSTLKTLDEATLSNLGMSTAIEALREKARLANRASITTNGVAANPAKDIDEATTPKRRGKSIKAATPASKSRKQTYTTSVTGESLLTDLKQRLDEVSLDSTSLLLHEAYILSSRTIRFRQNFEFQTRATTERALLKPGDYLLWHQSLAADSDEALDADDVRTVTSQLVSMPPASILYTLLQEAPTIINVRDLFDAFQSRFEPAGDVDAMRQDGISMEDLKATMTQFYRALAELKMIGLVKASTGTQIKRGIRGKGSRSAVHDIDFVAKTSWAGL